MFSTVKLNIILKPIFVSKSSMSVFALTNLSGSTHEKLNLLNWTGLIFIFALTNLAGSTHEKLNLLNWTGLIFRWLNFFPNNPFLETRDKKNRGVPNSWTWFK